MNHFVKKYTKLEWASCAGSQSICYFILLIWHEINFLFFDTKIEYYIITSEAIASLLTSIVLLI